MQAKKIKLSSKEILELIIEGILTAGIMVLVSFAILIIAAQFTDRPIVKQRGDFFLRAIPKPTFDLQLVSLHNLVYLLLIIFGIIVVYWRLLRRYHLMEMRHVIDAMQDIAHGHLEKRVNYQVNRNLQSVVDSINALVDSAVRSMEEERQIEKSKEELITNVSHDLRTPLTSIIGYLNLIEDDKNTDVEVFRKYAHTAFLKAKQMKSMTDDLFEYTKLTSARDTFKYTEFDMNALIEQLTADFALEAQRVGLNLESELTNRPLMVNLDAEKVGRLLANLVSNGLKYARSGTYIKIKLVDLKDKIKIQVENDGPEIPSNALPKIFDRFYRIDEARTTRSGTGLGLAIVKNIVNGLAGEISVVSNTKKTIFTIILPKGKVSDN